MATVKTEAAPYLDAFRADTAEPAWLADARRVALAAFGERGFPSRREEAWRFTSLRPLADKFFPPQMASRPTPMPMADMAARLRRYGLERSYRLVYLNGIFHSLLGDLPKGVWLGSMARAIAERPEVAKRAIADSDLVGGQPFASLNAALFVDGFVLALDEGQILDRPVEIVHIADNAEAASIHLRNVIALAPNSRVTVTETYIGKGPYWTNAVTNVSVGEGATLTHIKLQDEGTGALHFGLLRASLASSAIYRNFGLTLGANLSRQDVQVLLGDGAEVDVAGAYLQRGDQDATNAIVVDHAAPNAITRELFKGVLDERAHGAFLGTIRVREGAQKTDAKQTSRALLLSDRASVDTKPELEILADDVKCAHGAAVGDLDKETLFYLRARGIGADEARRMLIEAFVLEAVETVEQPELREHLARHVHRWLEREGT
ncbi:MAG TPA: Fe-S cluster assembly protein SufD [Stellaceae bacterium]|jgi:Fe-S cluster assembly protein SufD|nr:Fe-S cluster assembly protein SufD [Stellaceae bacterium]